MLDVLARAASELRQRYAFSVAQKQRSDSKCHFSPDGRGRVRTGEIYLDKRLAGLRCASSKGRCPCTAVVPGLGTVIRRRRSSIPRRGEPHEVQVEALKKYVTIQEADDPVDDDEAAATAGSIRARIAWSRCSFHSPCFAIAWRSSRILLGSMSTKRRTRVALDFLSQADALVMVLSCRRSGSHRANFNSSATS